MLEILIATAFLYSNLKTEIQVNLCGHFSTIESQLDLHKWNKKKSVETFFIDNKQLKLFNQGWVFKVRIDTDKSSAIVTLKKNEFQNSSEISPVDIQDKNCEYDLHGNLKKLACKLSHEISLAQLRQHQQNEDYAGLLSPAQLAWLNNEKAELPVDLKMTSPFIDRDYVFNFEGLKIALGLTVNNKQQEFIEISTRSGSENELAEQKRLLDYLKSHDIHVCENQSSIMTKLKLESFFN